MEVLVAATAPSLVGFLWGARGGGSPLEASIEVQQAALLEGNCMPFWLVVNLSFIASLAFKRLGFDGCQRHFLFQARAAADCDHLGLVGPIPPIQQVYRTMPFRCTLLLPTYC